MQTKEEVKKTYIEKYFAKEQQKFSELEGFLKKQYEISLELKLSLPQDSPIEEIDRRVSQEQSKFNNSDFMKVKGSLIGYNSLRERLDKECRSIDWFFSLLQDIGYNPENRKITILTTGQTGGSINAQRLARVLEVCKGEFVDRLEDADTAIYWGSYLCDYAWRTERPVIHPILNHLKDTDATGMIFFFGRNGYDFCYQNCWEVKELKDLANKGKKVHMIPTGYPDSPAYVATTG